MSDEKVSCFQKFKIWFKNIKIKIACSNCMIDKSETNIAIDYDGDGITDITIPI
jgi:hypothetical protein